MRSVKWSACCFQQKKSPVMFLSRPSSLGSAGELGAQQILHNNNNIINNNDTGILDTGKNEFKRNTFFNVFKRSDSKFTNYLSKLSIVIKIISVGCSEITLLMPNLPVHRKHPYRDAASRSGCFLT